MPGIDRPLLHHVEVTQTHLDGAQIMLAAGADPAIAILKGAPPGQTLGVGFRLDNQLSIYQTADLEGIGAVAERKRAACTHVSDQFGPFATQNIPATVSEAPYILDGLLMNETGRKIKEQYVNTGGFTDHVFAVTSLLGFRLMPRIRDLPSKRLYLFDPAAGPYSALSPTRPLVVRRISSSGSAVVKRYHAVVELQGQR